jgi:hypothetical protein
MSKKARTDPEGALWGAAGSLLARMTGSYLKPGDWTG